VKSTLISVLTPYRRHTPACPHRAKGRDWLKCDCPLWARGTVDGRKVYRSLKTRNLKKALRAVAEIEENGTKRDIPLREALAEWIRTKRFLSEGCLRKYHKVERLFADFLIRHEGVERVSEITAEAIDRYGAWRGLSALSWSKELQTVRSFLGYCVDRDWRRSNPASRVKPPHAPKPLRPPEPYTAEEIAAILAACGQFGRHPYERLRARALILLLRYTALRIGDALQLSRDKIRGGYLEIRTEKNGEPVRLPVPAELAAALDALPLPKGAPPDCPYYFWNGAGSVRALKNDGHRMLDAVFKASRVRDAHSHRFRHTLATEMLAHGATYEDVAAVLGNSPAIVRKHYARWSRGRELRLAYFLRRVHGEASACKSSAEAPPAGLSRRKQRRSNGAERGTRTPKGLLPLAPQASASASSATSAFRRGPEAPPQAGARTERARRGRAKLPAAFFGLL